jgi:coenzyme F420-dependent glucose-6-phosphate dehydrogenase
MVKFAVSPDIVEYSIRDLVKRVPLFEKAGFDAIWEGDHTLPWHHSGGHCSDVIVAMEAYLQVTRNIPVIGLVPPIGIRRQPVDVALAFATMGILHPGRVALTVGAGEAMNEKTATGLWFSPQERAERVEEAIKLIKMCWKSREYFQFKGKYFNTFFYLYDRPDKPIPLYCAANGPKMLKVAGEHCQGFISVGMPPQQYRAFLIPRFAEAARRVGRDPSKLDKIAWISTFYHPDIEKAFQSARRYGGLLIPECYHNIQDPRIIEERSSEVDDNTLTEAFNIASTPDELIAKFEAYIKAGVNYIVWADGSPDGSLTPKVCKEKIIPYIKEQYPQD